MNSPCNDYIYTYLKAKDSKFDYLIEKYGYLKLEKNKQIYEFLIENLIGQMLSKKVANLMVERLKKLCNNQITPESISTLSLEDIKNIGISKKKVCFISELTTNVLKGYINLDFEYLQKLDKEKLFNYLTSIKGVGERTAEMVMLFCLEFNNIFSWKDVALKRGILKVHNEYKTLSSNRFEKLRKLYNPYCSYACLYFYKANDDED